MFCSADGEQLCIYNKTGQPERLTSWITGKASGGVLMPPLTLTATPIRTYAASNNATTIPWFNSSLLVRLICIPVRSLIHAPLSLLFASGRPVALWSAAVQAVGSPGYFDQFWPLIRDDVRVDLSLKSLVEDTEYKRYYKTASGFSGKILRARITTATRLR